MPGEPPGDAGVPSGGPSSPLPELTPEQQAEKLAEWRYHRVRRVCLRAVEREVRRNPTKGKLQRGESMAAGLFTRLVPKDKTLDVVDPRAAATCAKIVADVDKHQTDIAMRFLELDAKTSTAPPSEPPPDVSWGDDLPEPEVPPSAVAP